MADLLFTLIIYPIKMIIEVVYVLAERVFHNPGMAILCVSGAVTLLCLPLYMRAEKWQETEREIRAKLEPKIKKIKAVFKGDEQYMILSTYYRQNHYHPVMALRSSFGLLIQIPFFIAAYTFLSHLEALQGVSFFFIKDLGKSDSLLNIGSISINVLPVLMTAVNIIAGAIYTKGFKLRDKIQLYGMAIVFLILLYNSPAGLVLYWTMNNVLSLVKNIFYKLKNPLRVCAIFAILLAVAVDFYLLLINNNSTLMRRMMLSFAVIAAVALPIILYYVFRSEKSIAVKAVRAVEQGISDRYAVFLFIFSTICLFLLAGTVLPSNVIVSSTQEFSFLGDNSSPFFWIQKSMSQAAGLFLFWPMCIFFLFPRRIKKLFVSISVCITVCAVINAFLFPGDYGLILNTLVFSDPNGLKHSFLYILLSVCSNIGICTTLLFCLAKKMDKNFSAILVFAIIGFGVISTVNVSRIATEYKRLEIIMAGNENTSDYSESVAADIVRPIFHLSKTGKNVFVIMLDRAISAFIPYIFEESPELYNQYSGFTYFPNTTSFGVCTNYGAPGLFGGYDYTPVELNKRSDEKLVDKHNEALLFMPLMFQKNGFDVTVSDLPYANYSWVPDLSIYKPYNIRALNTEGEYLSAWYKKSGLKKGSIDSLLSRNFLWYSMMKCSIPLLRSEIYYGGNYWSIENPKNFNFLNSYSVLDLMKELSTADVQGNTLTILTNNTTHESSFLQAPDYLPVDSVTNNGSSPFADTESYSSNAASIKRLGEWFNYLKENDVYDNTRIIIVSDHGWKLGLFPNLQNDIPCLENFNALLMVKDFNTKGSLNTDNSFMTNADVPSLAATGIIDNPRNPYTGKPVTQKEKKDGVIITSSGNWSVIENNGTVFNTQDSPWYKVHTNIFDVNNWSVIEND